VKKENILMTKSFVFALRIVKCYQYLQNEKHEYVLSKQLLRSGTSIGANIKEAEQTESKSDFIHKLSIALKEVNETEYWLDLLSQSGYLDKKLFDSIYADCKELLKLLISIIKTSKQKNGK
jgi:four helix bundle protein